MSRSLTATRTDSTSVSGNHETRPPSMREQSSAAALTSDVFSPGHRCHQIIFVPKHKLGDMRSRLMAIVCEGKRGRVYLPPTLEQEAGSTASGAGLEAGTGVLPPGTGVSDWRLWHDQRGATCSPLASWRHSRHCPALWSRRGRRSNAMPALGAACRRRPPVVRRRQRAPRYAEAVSVYLAFAVDKQADLGNSLCRWEPVRSAPPALRTTGHSHDLGLCRE